MLPGRWSLAAKFDKGRGPAALVLLSRSAQLALDGQTMDCSSVNTSEYLEIMRWAISIAVPALSGLIGVLVGAWLSGRRERAQRRHDFIAQQLGEFYSPLLGLRTEIRARSEFRVRVHGEADAAWRELCEAARRISVDELQRLTNERFQQFEKIIEFDNQRLTNELLPAYRKMVSLFRDNLWLAEPETRVHFPRLLEFVDVWDRSIAEALPREVLTRLGHDERLLDVLYADLQATHERLRQRLAQGKP